MHTPAHASPCHVNRCVCHTDAHLPAPPRTPTCWGEHAVTCAGTPCSPHTPHTLRCARTPTHIHTQPYTRPVAGPGEGGRPGWGQVQRRPAARPAMDSGWWGCRVLDRRWDPPCRRGGGCGARSATSAAACVREMVCGAGGCVWETAAHRLRAGPRPAGEVASLTTVPVRPRLSPSVPWLLYRPSVPCLSELPSLAPSLPHGAFCERPLTGHPLSGMAPGPAPPSPECPRQTPTRPHPRMSLTRPVSRLWL